MNISRCRYYNRVPVQAGACSLESPLRPFRTCPRSSSAPLRAELVVDGTSKEFEVTPPQAAVVWHFQEKESWPAEALAQACGMPGE